MAIRFISMRDHLEDYEKIVGLPKSKQRIANLYTDGSYSTNLNKSGYGIYLQHGDKYYCWGGEAISLSMAKRYEHEAFSRGVAHAKAVGATSINIYIDSKGVFDELRENKTKWAIEMLPLLDHCNIFLIYSHIGLYGNELADELSRMYLGGIQEEFHMVANSCAMFNVKKVAANLDELIARIKKIKKSPNEHDSEKKSPNEHDSEKLNLSNQIGKNLTKQDNKPLDQTTKTKLPNQTTKTKPPNQTTNTKQVVKAQPRKTVRKEKNVILQHPQTKEPYPIPISLYEEIKKFRERMIAQKGLKRKTVTDNYIAQEAYSRELKALKKVKDDQKNAA
jgi:ribonuclease HI